jgi:hypothetical protein
MPPPKSKVATREEMDKRLVDVILNLEVELKEIKHKLHGCHDLISNQQHEIIENKNQMAELLKIVRALPGNTERPEIEGARDIPYNLHSHFTNNVTLNESGPQGIPYIGDTADEETATQCVPTAAAEVQNAKIKQKPPKPSSTPVVLQNTGGPACTSRRGRPRRAAPLPASAGLDPATPNVVPATEMPVSTGPPSTESTKVPEPLMSGRAGGPSAPAVLTTGGTPRIQPSLRAAAPRQASLHVFNLSEETTAEDVLQHVRCKLGVEVAQCERLVVTRGQYSSFKLDVPAEKVHLVRNAQHWPANVSIRRFNFVAPKNLLGPDAKIKPH